MTTTKKTPVFGNESDMVAFRKITKSMAGIGALSQKVGMYIIRKLVADANYAKALSVNVQELPSWSLVQEVTQAPAPVFVRKAFRKFLKDTKIPLDGASIKLETLRKRLSDLESLQSKGEFPIIIEEEQERESAKTEKQDPTAIKLAESLHKKLTGENASRYEGAEKVAKGLSFMLNHPKTLEFVESHLIQIEQLRDNPGLLEAVILSLMENKKAA